MKDEIKEILDKLKDCVNNPIDIEVDQFTQEAYHIPNYFCLDATTNECKLLLDYITNLQEKLNRIDKLINTDYGWVSYYYKYNNRYLKSEIKEDINNILEGDKDE